MLGGGTTFQANAQASYPGLDIDGRNDLSSARHRQSTRSLTALRFFLLLLFSANILQRSKFLQYTFYQYQWVLDVILHIFNYQSLIINHQSSKGQQGLKVTRGKHSVFDVEIWGIGDGVITVAA
jgi:hypothetical protein